MQILLFLFFNKQGPLGVDKVHGLWSVEYCDWSIIHVDNNDSKFIVN